MNTNMKLTMSFGLICSGLILNTLPVFGLAGIVMNTVGLILAFRK